MLVRVRVFVTPGPSAIMNIFYSNAAYITGGLWPMFLKQVHSKKPVRWPNPLGVGSRTLLPAGFCFHLHCRGAHTYWGVILYSWHSTP